MAPTTLTSMFGADADELERVAATLRSAADELDGHAASVSATVRSVDWIGGVATRFGANWHGTHQPRMASTARLVRDAAAQLDHNAVEQRRASLATPGAAGGAGPPTTVLGGSGPILDAPGARVLDRIGELLATLGIGRDVLEALAEHAHVFDGSGVDRLFDVIDNDAFVSLLSGLDQVLEIGDVLVDLISDFVEHPGLPVDERIVHALADTAARVGADQGVEYAANFLAQAATTALLPGLGVVLAPFAGHAAEVIADAMIAEVVDAIDGATDIVDTAADAAVDAYRALKEAFGLALDVARVATDVAGDAVDLAGDAAGAVIGAAGIAVDAGGAVMSIGADALGQVVGSLNPFD